MLLNVSLPERATALDATSVKELMQASGPAATAAIVNHINRMLS